MARPIAFGIYQFRTKSAAISAAQHRIAQYAVGEKLGPEDELFFVSLFSLHSEYEQKRGRGIDHITVERDFHNNRCLYIHRTDGSCVDCSWRHCIQPASTKTVVSMAFRRAVKDIVIEFKQRQLSMVNTCPELGIPLTYENSHASYISPTFQRLVDEFLAQRKLDIASIDLTNPKPMDSDQRGILGDKKLEHDWRAYHLQNANLQLISEQANLRRSKS